MSVILEFTVDSAEFTLGQVLSNGADRRLELERIVPTGDAIMPFVWVTADEFTAFEEHVRDSPRVKALHALDRIDGKGLYRIEWADRRDDHLIGGIAMAEAAVLEARGDEHWMFRLRFTDHERLSQFHNYLTDHDIRIHIERTYTLSEETERGHRFDLSEEQREALVLALRRGYFDTPSEASLDELAAELDITRQALSNRIRRGTETVLRKTLLSSVADFDEGTWSD